MNAEIIGQLRFLLLSLCLGMAYMAGYDILRLFRWLVPHNKGWVWIEDLIYWCLAAFPGFYVFFLFNQGVIRWYGILSVFLGALLYEMGISRVVRQWGNRIFLAKKRKIYRKIIQLKNRWKHFKTKRKNLCNLHKDFIKNKKRLQNQKK